MRVLVADVENSVYRHEDKRIDNGPYRSSNRLVSVGYKFVGEETVNYDFYYHKELDKPADPAKFQAALDQADLLVGHNVKHETEWILESGFTYDGPVFDTMIAAYVLNRGQKAELSLEDLCIKYGLPLKKAELISEFWNKGVGFEEMPIEIVEEYGRGDVVSTEALYLKMLEEYEKPDNIRLKPVLNLMNEFCYVLAEVERNGIQIDLNALDEVEREFLEEREQLQRSLMDLTHELMGDRPINLNSPEQLSWVLFSRKVKDKNEWARVFNIGVDHRGKPKPRPRMKDSEFRQNVSRHTEVLYRQKAHQCPDCKGTGRIQKFKKDGTPYKNTNRCKTCDATGLVYEDLKKIAGLKLKPGGIKDVSANGFSTSKDALQFYANSLRGQGNEVGAQFLENMIRLNAVDSYLSTFVNGIRRATIPQTSRLHTNFNQCVTATGRLSSSDPNFQNQPRGNTFPVRKCVVSRFEGGSIIEADFGQLEFRVAGFLAQDQQVLYDVMHGVDVHSNTAKALTEAGEPTDRQGAKANCVPLNTEILTRDGWKTYHDVEVGEEVLTYSQSKDCMEWQPLLEKVYYEDQEVIKLHNGHWSVECTPNHRWYGYKRRDGGPMKGRYNEPCVFTAEEMNSEHNIYTTAPYTSDRSSVSPRDAAVLAWLWGDGSVRFQPTTGRTSQCGGSKVGCQAVILQSKADMVKSLDDLLDGVATNRYIKEPTSKGGRSCVVWRLKSAYVREVYDKAGLDYYEPDYVKFVLGLSDEARKAWLEAMIMAEGTYRRHGEVRIAQNQGPLAEAIKLAAHLCGYGVRVTEYRARTGNFHQKITLRTRRHVTGQRMKKTPNGRKDVWCPRTVNGTWVMRQNCYTNEREVITITGNTFKPLYGGQTGTPAEMAYFDFFLNRYSGIAEWHERLCETALRTGIVSIPSGREYAFPNAERMWNGNVRGRTQIVNYPVQGFATADIVPLACIRLYRLMKKHKVKSLFVLQVHDSIVIDCYPGEEDLMVQLLTEAMVYIAEEMKERWGVEYNFPVTVEIARGSNWMNTEVVAEQEWRPEESERIVA